MTVFVRAVLLLVLPLLSAACRPHRPNGPFDAEHPAAAARQLERYLRRHPEDDRAWLELAHIEWLHLGDTAKAVAILDRLADKGDPVARTSRLLIAQARLDADAVVEHAEQLLLAAARVPAAADDRAFVLAAAELAARALARIHGDREGDDARYTRFYESLPRDRLPFAVNQPLVSLRGNIARAAQEPQWNRYYAEEGCVQTWHAGPLRGSLASYELLSDDPSAFVRDPQATVVPLACVVRVWNPTARAGVRTLRTFVEVGESGLALDLGAEEPTRFYVDGQLVHRTDVVKTFPTARARLQVDVRAGWHELAASTTVSDANAWVLVRAVGGTGAAVAVASELPKGTSVPPGELRAKHRTPPWPAAVVPVESEVYAPLRHALAVDAALAQGDPDRAELAAAQLRRFGQFAEGAWLRARFEHDDPTRTVPVSAAREQQALQTALNIDPTMDAARSRLIEILLARGDHTEAERALAKVPEQALRSVDGELLRFRIHRTRGSEYLAEEALSRAEIANPENCRVLMARRSIAQERKDVKAEDALAEALARCSGSLELRARLAETRGRFDDAKALWQQVLVRVPDDLEALESLGRLAAAANDTKAATEVLERVLELNPRRLWVHIALADLAAAAGELTAAKRKLARALELVPYSNGLRAAAASLGLVDDLMEFRVDGHEALDAYRAGERRYDGVAEVLVLDRSVARVYAGGGQRQIIHLVVHLLSKDALDRYGEIQIPRGAELLTLRTIKPNGEVLEPELIPGKDGLSLRHLELGDFLEYEFVIEREPSRGLGGYIDVSTFRFQSLDVPYHRSELLVVHPKELQLRVDRRNGPPAEQVRELRIGGRPLVVKHYLAQEVARLGVEPAPRDLLDEVPNVRVYTPLPVDAWLRNLAENIRYSGRTNPQLRGLARRLTAGHPDARSKLHALWRWILDNVEESGDLSTAATATLANKNGSRLMLLRAMLEVVGIPSDLWLARSVYGPSPLPQGNPLVEEYDAPLLAVRTSPTEPPVAVSMLSDVMPLGYLAPGYPGAPALVVPLTGDREPGSLQLPQQAASFGDRRRWTLAIAVDAKGSGEVSGTITLQGMEAVAWRQALHEVDRDRIEEIFQQAELGWLGGTTVSSLTIENEKQLDAPLRLNFKATANAMGVNQGGALVLRSAPLPLNQGARFSGLPQRSTGLLVAYAPLQEAEITFKLTGATFTDVPAATVVESAFGKFERVVEQGGVGKDTVVLSYRSSLREGEVEPDRYRELAEFARKVESATTAMLRAKPGRP